MGRRLEVLEQIRERRLMEVADRNALTDVNESEGIQMHSPLMREVFVKAAIKRRPKLPW